MLTTLFSAIQSAGARLTVLDLSDNAFGPIGVEAMVEFLESPSAYSLKVLKFNNNGLGPTGGVMLAKALNRCYEDSSATGEPLALEVFISGRGRLENEGAAALAPVFLKMGSLKEVVMPQNGINAPGIEALAAGLATNTGLKILNLSDNTFSTRGGRAMADALTSLDQLEVINFDDCLIRSAAFKKLAAVLTESHPNLKVHNLHLCRLAKMYLMQCFYRFIRLKKGSLVHLNVCTLFLRIRTFCSLFTIR